MEIGSDHPDPFRNSMQETVYRAVQVGSFAVTGSQVYAYHRRAQARIAAERDHRARRALTAQLRAEADADRARWEPALDPAWLRRADVPDTARAWGAALPYADRAVPWYEPAAATAMHRCEERLRLLHPYAMNHYDRLCSDGVEPGEAMRQAAPLFARHPHPRDAPAVARPALGAAPGAGAGPVLQPDGGPVPAGRNRAGRACDEDFPLPIRDVMAYAAEAGVADLTGPAIARAVAMRGPRARP
jgi:hypothetical protein